MTPFHLFHDSTGICLLILPYYDVESICIAHKQASLDLKFNTVIVFVLFLVLFVLVFFLASLAFWARDVRRLLERTLLVKVSYSFSYARSSEVALPCVFVVLLVVQRERGMWTCLFLEFWKGHEVKVQKHTRYISTT